MNTYFNNIKNNQNKIIALKGWIWIVGIINHLRCVAKRNKVDFFIKPNLLWDMIGNSIKIITKKL